jgi:YD repeat-containing protein
MPIKSTWHEIAGMLALVVGQGTAGYPHGTGAYLQDAISGSGVSTERYEYDALGRLRKVTFANGSVTTYTLDKAGNRSATSTTRP